MQGTSGSGEVVFCAFSMAHVWSSFLIAAFTFDLYGHLRYNYLYDHYRSFDLYGHYRSTNLPRI